jgi:hypothetical protein
MGCGCKKKNQTQTQTPTQQVVTQEQTNTTDQIVAHVQEVKNS